MVVNYDKMSPLNWALMTRSVLRPLIVERIPLGLHKQGSCGSNMQDAKKNQLKCLKSIDESSRVYKCRRFKGT